ncbi:hypothetical protein T07_13059 [Trichinella nelsoni]|uniref:Uncharacterized protein n=1 Tax=Trichinella nelsoni TaxID=6336 RepID=A0A0V0S811_9BILA|nr:hypothetical protein T07_13059 [Trichinella nelsoni]
MLKKRIAVEANIIPQIYDEKAVVPSAEPSASGQFSFFREVRNECSFNVPHARADLMPPSK